MRIACLNTLFNINFNESWSATLISLEGADEMGAYNRSGVVWFDLFTCYLVVNEYFA